MKIELIRNLSEPNKVIKELESHGTITGSLKETTSILSPTMVVKTGLDVLTIATTNYMYIEDFKRYYFITDIKSVKTGLWEISGRVDVLQSYSDLIKQQTAIVKRQENKWNLYLNDGSFRVYQNPMVLTKPFASGFNSFNFVLSVAG